jgi:hypothetical protein
MVLLVREITDSVSSQDSAGRKALSHRCPQWVDAVEKGLVIFGEQ